MSTWSRRAFLRTPTGLAIAAGVAVGEEPQRPHPGSEPLKVIDTHIHVVHPGLPGAPVKYAHPLLVDEVAVDHPDVRFVLAHVGYPWTIDTAEVLYKNNKQERANVWTDLSGLVVGTAQQFQAYREQGFLEQVAVEIRKAFAYAERPDRFLYGSDWPLAPLGTYRDFIREAIPEKFHQAVFHDNARSLFQLTKSA